MIWVKKGLILGPQGLDWMVSHATAPVAERINKDIYRIYFSGRDKENRAKIGYVEVDIKNLSKILYITEKPVLDIGPLGTFDDCGVMTSWITTYGHKKFLYYTGWIKGVTVPYYFYIGLAISTDYGKTFKRVSNAPILGRNSYDPYLTASPCVLLDNGTWRMWYVSSTKRERYDGKTLSYYHIRYTDSNDGINWNKERIICIDFKPKEYAISRPCVIKRGKFYRMWYSYREFQQNYRIGYAESKDGIRWVRKDEKVGIGVSTLGWDSEMIEYPFVFEHNKKLYMLYNGNNFGKDGFGCAVLNR